MEEVEHPAHLIVRIDLGTRTRASRPDGGLLVQTLAAAGELQRDLQRDLQRELTYDGLRAAEAKGSKGGRRPAIKTEKTDAVRTAYLEGGSIAALSREHGVSRGAGRTAGADLMPEHTPADQDAPAPELPVALHMPGKVADFLRAAELEPAEWAALDQGVTVRRGQGYTLRGGSRLTKPGSAMGPVVRRAQRAWPCMSPTDASLRDVANEACLGSGEDAGR
ncbi:hypothetical protein NE236_04095 [Actinoallomurus purpureus]|uniref:hypothetical protein n=1 Tax=Actinoallomurus purpureus TaxID=478114 RepID=UPI002092E0AF|nr:hypothetical protein [Actinoallomurus purpureus]MCO6004152.1 hypothetical protein [Actinoallomurus purpureus]